MKAIELKCNNYVMLYNNVARIIPNDFVKWSDEKWEMKDFKPIPLTEKWLKEFGFKSVFSGAGYIKNRTEIGYNYNGFYIIASGLKIEYIHQLQNLYFALTNTELEIK